MIRPIAPQRRSPRPVRHLARCRGCNAHSGAALIGVDFDNPGGTVPTNWNQFGGFGIPALASNLVDEGGIATVVDLAITRVGFQVGTTGTAPNANTLPTHTQSLSGLSGLTFARGSTPAASMLFQWQSLVPGRAYNVWVFGLTDTTTAARNHVAISGSGAAIAYDQNMTGANLWVNGQVGTNSALESFAREIIANSSGQITIQVTPVSVGGAVGIAGLALRAKLSGDFNQNGVVDSADYVVWRNGLSTTYAQGDYAVWRANFGNTLGSGSTVNTPDAPDSVPEPTGASLAVIAMISVALTWARRIR